MSKYWVILWECLEVFIDGKWRADRIEFDHSINSWYLVYSKLYGEQLENLIVR